LLCSDGLYDTLPKEHLASLLSTIAADQAAETLVTAAAEAGASDNITAIVVHSGYIAPVALVSRPTRQRNWGLLGVVGLLTLAVLFLLLRPLLGSLGTEAVAPTAVPAATVPGSGLATVAPTETPPPHATSTVAPTATATAEATVLPTETAVVITELRGCAVSAVAYVWRSSAINRSDCASTTTDQGLTPGEPVIILNATPVSALGPDDTCQPHQFIEVQSEARPNIQGWVIPSQIRPLSAGESCTP
jgi:hypothetical protein